MVKLEPFNCSNCFFLNSENRRLTVSRVVPIICANSSWVTARTCEPLPPSYESKGQGSSNFANLSASEFVSPRIRISSIRRVIVSAELFGHSDYNFSVFA
jgi:hypothetical protein